MTHPDLVLRAEQAVIGEALRDRQRLDDIAYLTPDRLAHPTHRALLTALIESRTSEPAIAADRVPELIAERAAIRGVDADYLRQLADASPRSGNIATYARMVQEAAVRRDLSLHVDRARAVGAGVRGPDPLLDRVAAVMRRNELATPVARLDEPAPAPFEPRAAQTTEHAVRVEVRLEKQDAVLADLLQHPEQIREVSSWLYPEVFDEGPRREVYEAIVVVEERGEPVEQLTVEWEIYRQDPQTYTVEVEVSVEERPDYLARLAATAVVVGAAVEISGELLAEDIRASLTADFSKIDVATRPAGVESKVDVDIRAGAPAPRVEPAPLLQPPPVQQIPTIQPTIRP
ncbi:replicative DNA helicase [Kitasatospora sp. GP30]|uniref:DnaB-like helicase N-terminal domain-containing protein n=1 Tax=Kitasatospora sp. GP30 TaxID=3035084 RepID=UPI000C70E3CA|nr:DnaB-like helicase N-terminal domain-containing protein [Kitasatospora sp. GP30]MDH6138447.1 replicative DNA helicase [Kitasatospora sp. GP30]